MRHSGRPIALAGFVALTTAVGCGSRTGIPGLLLVTGSSSSSGGSSSGGLSSGGMPTSGGSDSGGTPSSGSGGTLPGSGGTGGIGQAGTGGNAGSGGGAGTAGTAGSAGAGGAIVDPCASEPGPPDTGWVKTWGGSGYERVKAVYQTKTGFLVAGSFNGSADFDPGPGVDQLTANGRDLTLSGYDSSGKYLWTRRMAGSVELDGSALAPDDSVYFTTNFSGTLDPDPTTTGDELIAADNSIAVIKRRSNGDLAWAHFWPTRTFYAVPAVAVDGADGSVFVAGTFSGITDFDAGSGIDELDSAKGSAFVEKLDANGNHLWVRAPWPVVCYSALVAVGPDRSLWAAGSCAGTNGSVVLNVSKLDATGSPLTTATWSIETYPGALAVDRDGALYLAGATRSGDFDPGPGVDNHQVNGLADSLLLKLDRNGNYAWARTWGGGEINWNDIDQANALFIDACGSPVVGGIAANPFDADPGPAQDLRAGGMYLSKFKNDGTFAWAKTWTGAPVGYSYTQIYAVQSPSLGRFLVGGTFAGTVDFGLIGAKDPRTSAGNEDAFFMQLGP